MFEDTGVSFMRNAREVYRGTLAAITGKRGSKDPGGAWKFHSNDSGLDQEWTLASAESTWANCSRASSARRTLWRTSS